ncbi:MAG: zinc ribbon domain-containing protein, partial [bacterium]|nr:zinc ribbon domain-containing protein [bacterium]
MPIYEYECLECSKRFDELISHYSNNVSIHCPGCHSSKVARLMSMFGFTSGAGASANTGSSSCSSCSSKNCSTCH